VTTVPERIAPPTPQSSFEDEEVVWTAAVSPGNVTPTWVSLGRRAEEETEGETEEKTKAEIEETEETERDRRRDRRNRRRRRKRKLPT